MFRTGRGSSCLLSVAVSTGASVAVLALSPAIASAGPGYEPDGTIVTEAELPRGIAIDQSTQDIYLAELTTNLFGEADGQVEQLDSSGNPTADSPFTTGGTDYFTGVAASSVTHSIYAYQTELSTPRGLKGTPKITSFSSSGAIGTSFSTTKSTAAQPAVDASDHIYFPNDSNGTVQVFSSTGTLLETIACDSCAEDAFVKPTVAALDASGNLFVVDIADGGRVVEFKPSGGSYAYDSVLQSGAGAVAVGVDPSSNDIFVGDYDEGTYHVVAYDSSGVQFDDFGGGILAAPPFDIESAGQIAANATTHRVYVTDPGGRRVFVFKRIAAVPAPTASTSAPSPVGQLGATLRAMVDPNGHGLTDCGFEYTKDADFQANGFANATTVQCGSKPFGSTDISISVGVSGLKPATAYDYRIAVTTNGGTAKGTAQAFETLPPLPPTTTTGTASAVTLTTATLEATVNANGGPVSNCHFEYAADAKFDESGFSGASSGKCSPTPSGTLNQTVSTKVSGLAAGTEYHVRVVATNNSGKSESTDKPFSTLAETCETNAVLCPLPEEKHEAPALPAPTLAPPIPKPLKCHKGFKKKKVRGKQKCVKIKKHRHR